jgi:hypothetical protein
MEYLDAIRELPREQILELYKYLGCTLRDTFEGFALGVRDSRVIIPCVDGTENMYAEYVIDEEKGDFINFEMTYTEGMTRTLVGITRDGALALRPLLDELIDEGDPNPSIIKSDPYKG